MSTTTRRRIIDVPLPAPHPTAVALGRASPFPPADDEAEDASYEDDTDYARLIRAEQLFVCSWLAWTVIFLLLSPVGYALRLQGYIAVETEYTIRIISLSGCCIGIVAFCLVTEYVERANR